MEQSLKQNCWLLIISDVCSNFRRAWVRKTKSKSACDKLNLEKTQNVSSYKGRRRRRRRRQWWWWSQQENAAHLLVLSIHKCWIWFKSTKALSRFSKSVGKKASVYLFVAPLSPNLHRFSAFENTRGKVGVDAPLPPPPLLLLLLLLLQETQKQHTKEVMERRRTNL